MKKDLTLQTISENLIVLTTAISKAISEKGKNKITDTEVLDTLNDLLSDVEKHENTIRNLLSVNVDDYHIIGFLNRTLKLEYRSIFSYQACAAAIEDPSLKKHLLSFGLSEMDHAKLLSEKIKNLGGTPVFNAPPRGKEKTITIEEMLNEHKNGEIEAVALLEEGLHNINDPELNWFIGKLKLDEQEHLKELDLLLSEYNGIKKVITITSKVKWHDDYVEDDKERPWVE